MHVASKLFLTSCLGMLHCFLGAQIGTGYPAWTLAGNDRPGIEIVDWTVSPPAIRSVPNTTSVNSSASATAFDLCGNIVFIVAHTGYGNMPFNLYLYAPDGRKLLTINTPNGPGLNAWRNDSEMQVVKVPNTLDQWYIIYKQWMPDDGAPFGGSGSYTPSPILYSRVQYEHREIIVLERDEEIKVNGIAHTYVAGKAVSPEGPEPGTHYLYLCRREAYYDFSSLDRFIIDENGISFDQNSGEIADTWWYLCIPGSRLELSPDGKRIAYSSRNEEDNMTDIVLFDAQQFSNEPGAYQRIVADELILEEDGQYLPVPMSVSAVHAQIPELKFLKNFSKKISFIEFSPDGNYLYIGNGGYVEFGITNTTYFGQIKIGPHQNPEPYPYFLRMKIQQPPGNFNAISGAGGEISQFGDQWNSIKHIQKAFDGKMYFVKRSDSALFVVPEPDTPLEHDLEVTDIGFSNSQHPDIRLSASILRPPDQIDGYIYQQFDVIPVSLGEDIGLCEGETETLDAGNQFLSYIWNTGSQEQQIMVQDSGDYWVEVMDVHGCLSQDTVHVEVGADFSLSLGNDTTLCEGDSVLLTMPLTDIPFHWQNGSTDSVLWASQQGWYWVEATDGPCTRRDSVYLSLHSNPRPDLGTDTTICNGTTLTLDPGNFYSYLWQDGSSAPALEASDQGTYWVKVSDGYCEGRDTITVITEECECSLYFPNCFTPNGDGVNDEFYGKGVNIPQMELYIYNRWGQKLFEGYHLKDRWDGEFNKRLCPQGVYYFVAFYRCLSDPGFELSRTAKGSVTLLR